MEFQAGDVFQQLVLLKPALVFGMWVVEIWYRTFLGITKQGCLQNDGVMI